MIRLLLALALLGGGASDRPDILWIVVDDMSANLGCYGEKTIETPNLDRLAREGTRFTRAYTTAPVCSPSRSALITGCYQTSIGAHQHRSGRGAEKIRLPEGVETVPALLRKAGYRTSITSWPATKAQGKTDYNFEWDPAIYGGSDGPSFTQVQLHGGKHRDGRGLSEAVKKALVTLTSPDVVKLPPYYPDDPVIRRDWANYLDAVRYTDLQVGEILKTVDAAKTLVFFITDHGISHARGKQFLYDEGLHIPMIVRGPGVAANATRTDLVEHIDLAAATLAAAGVAIPAPMRAKDILAKDYQARDAVFAARDRCDETVERLRSVRTSKWKYIRNFFPKRPHLQPNQYKDGKPTLRRLRELHGSGELKGLPEQLLFAPERAPEELYDLEADPFETKNLADVQPEVLKDLRARLDAWMKETGDRGFESPAMYDSDMAVYLAEKKEPAARKTLEDNIALMKRWAAEGK
ncbi:MAG TPA: sulfatase [Planctomycetota bacterium]